MPVRFPAYVPVLLIVGFGATIGCGDGSIAVTTPGSIAGVTAAMTAEPAAARPQFLQTSTCPGRPAFGLGLTITIVADGDVILQRLRFAFTDRFGTRSLPDVFSSAIPAPSAAIPVSGPIPIPPAATLPGSPPVGVPGAAQIENLNIGRGASRSLPFFLRFGCGVVPDGVLIVSGDTNGANSPRELRVVVEP
jgi:hypothetical protein